MRAAIISLMTLAVVGMPAAAGAGWHDHHCHDLHVSGDSDFRFEGELLYIAHRDGDLEDEVTVTKDGQLTINGSDIEVDGKSRKLLKKFYAEAATLDEQAAVIAKDAEAIASEATGFAVMTVAAVLESLSGKESKVEKKAARMETDFEERVALIEEMAEDIEDRADRIVALSEDLNDRVPELRDLGWFLDN
jgi:hypothetical protein